MLMISEVTRKQYVENLVACGRFSDASRGTGYGPSTFVALRKQDASFDAACEEALQFFRERLEAEAFRRGVEGVDEPVFQRGAHVGDRRVYSDRLLELMLKRHVPEFREKVQVDANVKGGVLVVGGMAADADDWAKKFAPSDDSGK